MNKFDVRYDIRLAKYEEIEKIMTFLNEHWREGHIMATDRELFEYEYVNEGKVNFILAVDKETDEVEGIFGFLNCSKTEDPEKKDIWGSMWKVVDTRKNMPFLGVELAKRVKELTGCRMQIGNGANPKTTIPLRKMLFKEKTAKMKHFYLLNTSLNEYKIAVINEYPKKNQFSIENENKLIQFDSFEHLSHYFDVESLESLPYKDNWYINKRYFNHPYYKYQVFGVQNPLGIVNAVLVCREVHTNGSKVLRIMDYLGDESLFEGLFNPFRKILLDNEYEYIDFYVLGFEEKYIRNAGFILREETSTNIIPNYFEPFTQANVDIWAHYQLEGTKFFKADGDQDRPNLKR